MASFCFIAGVHILALLWVCDPCSGACHGPHPALLQLLGVSHKGVDLPGLHQLEEVAGVALRQVPHLVAQQRDGGVGSDILPRVERAVGGRGWVHWDVPCRWSRARPYLGGRVDVQHKGIILRDHKPAPCAPLAVLVQQLQGTAQQTLA